LCDRKDIWPIKKPFSVIPRCPVPEQMEEEDSRGTG